jgi:putative DNA primase/helicase
MSALPDAGEFELPDAWRVPVAFGFSVFPVKAMSKEPLVPWKGYQTSKASPETIQAWASCMHNVGIATGAISGLVVLDLDGKEAVKDAEKFGLPQTITALTPNGLHLYFRHPGFKVGNRAGLRPGWDIRGDGGYIVAPGSIHPSGTEYRWENSPESFELAEIPDWLLELITKPQTNIADNVTPFPVSGKANAMTALKKELKALHGALEGCRNDQLNKSAYALAQFVAADLLPYESTRELLRETALSIGLSASEVEATLESGWTAGLAKPKAIGPLVHINSSDPGTGDVPCFDGEVSEDAIALAFTSRYAETLRFDHDEKSWYKWTGARWRRDKQQSAFHYARELGRSLGEGKRQLCKASVTRGAESFARADPTHAVDGSIWDSNAMLLGTPLGTVELKSGQLRNADPNDYITKLTTHSPEEGEPTLWLKFLHEALGGDADIIAFLQRWCGYCLTGLTSEHALFFIYGPGGNGKSVFINTISAILGDYAVNAAMETFTASKFDRHSTELAMLAGARMVTASETEEGRSWAEARIKQLTGGDPITARYMRQDNFTYRPQFKLMIAGNHAPSLRNVDDAMRRRFNIVPFTAKPAKPDLGLEEKLRAELPQILSWAIAGCLDWQANGLVPPPKIAAATADYFDSQDLLGQWIDENCELAPAKIAYPTPLFNDWRDYALEAGEVPGSAKSFKSALEKRGIFQKKTNGTRSYRGIALRPKGAEGAHGGT